MHSSLTFNLLYFLFKYDQTLQDVSEGRLEGYYNTWTTIHDVLVMCPVCFYLYCREAQVGIEIYLSHLSH